MEVDHWLKVHPKGSEDSRQWIKGKETVKGLEVLKRLGAGIVIRQVRDWMFSYHMSELEETWK